MPSASQPTPATATSGCRTVTTTNASPVPSPPKTANSGTSGRAMRTLPGPRYGRGASGWRIRSRITETCAIVNDSIAPNAYMFPRKAAWPGSSVTIATAPKIRIPIHGVLYRGCRRRSASGTWRWMPIE